MKKRTGLYPGVQVDAAGCGVVSQAGGVALVEAARASGLDRVLSEALGPWRKPLAIHDPAKVLLDLAVALALGGDCLADVAVLRAEPGVYGRVASDPTVSRMINALAKDARGRWRRSTRRGRRPGRGCGSWPGDTPRARAAPPSSRWFWTSTRRW